MKVDSIWIASITATQSINKAKITENKKSFDKDGLVVSDKANIFQALLKKAQETPSIREEKITDLKDQIARGNFRVDANKIAQIILSQEE